MARPKIDYDRAAKILIDTFEVGSAKAAERWKVTERTIQNYKTKLETDASLQEAFRRLSSIAKATWDRERAQAELGWRLEAHKALRASLATHRKLLERAEELAKSTDDIRVVAKLIAEVSKAVQRMGELDVAREALGVGSGDRQQGSAPAANAGGDPRAAEGEAPES